MDKYHKILFSVIVLLFAVSMFGFYNLKKDIQSSVESMHLMQDQLKAFKSDQDEKLLKQTQSFEKAKNDLEKYKMMALETKELVSSNQRPQVSNVVKNWRPYASYIICSWTGGEEEYYGSGSGKIEKIDEDGKAYIMTNKHVILHDEKPPTECLITFPEITKIYSIENPEVQTHETLDIGYLVISDPDANITRLAADITKERICTKEAVAGDAIIALGYPGIGVSGDVTVTDGIVAGIDAPYYISTVKLDYGNSGGLAILVEENCYLGVPTASITGDIESLAKILRYNDIVKKINGI
jgi:S1-C subfamily serine protease